MHRGRLRGRGTSVDSRTTKINRAIATSVRTNEQAARLIDPSSGRDLFLDSSHDLLLARSVPRRIRMRAERPYPLHLSFRLLWSYPTVRWKSRLFSLFLCPSASTQHARTASFVIRRSTNREKNAPVAGNWIFNPPARARVQRGHLLLPGWCHITSFRHSRLIIDATRIYCIGSDPRQQQVHLSDITLPRVRSVLTYRVTGKRALNESVPARTRA